MSGAPPDKALRALTAQEQRFVPLLAGQPRRPLPAGAEEEFDLRRELERMVVRERPLGSEVSDGGGVFDIYAPASSSSEEEGSPVWSRDLSPIRALSGTATVGPPRRSFPGSPPAF